MNNGMREVDKKGLCFLEILYDQPACFVRIYNVRVAVLAEDFENNKSGTQVLTFDNGA
jgi:hypothetical protein